MTERPAIPDALLEGLNAPQAQAVSTLDGPVMVVAGPGSGKTRVLTHRVAALLATGTPAHQILAVTFTNKAAREMRERLEHLIGQETAQRLWVSTFHALCVRLLRRFGASVGLSPTFNIADTDDQKKIMKDLLPGFGLMPEDAKRYTSAISWAKNNLQDASTIESDLVKVSEVFAAYQQELARQSLVDFDDLLLLTLQMLRTDAEVLTQCQERFRFIMVDEYQDTNQVQYEIVQLLSATNRNLFVVGDHDQSIYQWRGATSAAVEGFTDDFPGAVVIQLSQNYRSTKRIVDVSRSIIEPNPSKHRGELWTDNPDGEPVTVLECNDDLQEAAYIVSQLAKLSGTKAILVRTNAQTRPFETELTARRVAYDVVGAQRFFDRAEIKDTLAWLRLTLNYSDEAALRRVVTSPKRGLGPTTLTALIESAQALGTDPITYASDAEFHDELPTRTRTLLASLTNDVAKVQAAAALSPAKAIRAVLDLGLRASLEKEPERLANVERLLNDATLFESTPVVNEAFEEGAISTPTGIELTRAFVESATLASSADQGGDGPAVVSLITGHASKGREFDHVFVAGVEENVYPHRLVGTDEAQIAEERRLLFVAASRARLTLTISWCQRRMVFGSWEQSGPSPFLEDLPDHVIERSLDTPKTTRPQWGTPLAKKGFSSPKASTPSARRPAASPRPSPQVAVDPFVPLTKEVLIAGTIVTHPTFGTGRVLEDATDVHVKIDFAGQNRTLALAFAHLTVQNPDSGQS